jgi:hypothetical protein
MTKTGVDKDGYLTCENAMQFDHHHPTNALRKNGGPRIQFTNTYDSTGSKNRKKIRSVLENTSPPIKNEP